jgi:hypothetical protein
LSRISEYFASLALSSARRSSESTGPSAVAGSAARARNGPLSAQITKITSTAISSAANNAVIAGSRPRV